MQSRTTRSILLVALFLGVLTMIVYFGSIALLNPPLPNANTPETTPLVVSLDRIEFHRQDELSGSVRLANPTNHPYLGIYQSHPSQLLSYEIQDSNGRILRSGNAGSHHSIKSISGIRLALNPNESTTFDINAIYPFHNVPAMAGTYFLVWRYQWEDQVVESTPIPIRLLD